MSECKTELIIVGGGGHARVVISICKSLRRYNIVGYTDLVNNGYIDGVPYLGDDSLLPALYQKGIGNIFVAIGDNKLRNRVFDTTTRIGFNSVSLISPFAIVDSSVVVGKGVVIMPGAIVNAGTSISDNIIINTKASIDHDGTLHKSCHIAPGSTLAGKVRVGEGAFIGTGANIIPEISVGEWSVVGAGATVIHDLPNNSLALGVPAKIIFKY